MPCFGIRQSEEEIFEIEAAEPQDGLSKPYLLSRPYRALKSAFSAMPHCWNCHGLQFRLCLFESDPR
jgi:hypothetical protein